MKCDVCGKSCVVIFPLPFDETRKEVVFACLTCQLKDLEGKVKVYDPDDPDHERA